jgi:hypothetical protein
MVLQCTGEKLSHAIHRVFIPWHRVHFVVKERRHRLANRMVTHTNGKPARQTTDYSTLDQALGVDYQIIVFTLQSMFEGPKFVIKHGPHKTATPAPDSNGDNLINGRVP